MQQTGHCTRKSMWNAISVLHAMHDYYDVLFTNQRKSYKILFINQNYIIYIYDLDNFLYH
jgi:hypothetical protein